MGGKSSDRIQSWKDPKPGGKITVSQSLSALLEILPNSRRRTTHAVRRTVRASHSVAKRFTVSCVKSSVVLTVACVRASIGIRCDLNDRGGGCKPSFGFLSLSRCCLPRVTAWRCDGVRARGERFAEHVNAYLHRSDNVRSQAATAHRRARGSAWRGVRAQLRVSVLGRTRVFENARVRARRRLRNAWRAVANRGASTADHDPSSWRYGETCHRASLRKRRRISYRYPSPICRVP